MPVRLCIWVVEASRRHAPFVVALAALLTVLCGWFAATNLQIDTDTDKLISSQVPWRQREAELDRLFPQHSDLIAVIDAATPDQAEDAAAALAARLAARPALFRNVAVPDQDPFFRRNGILFMPLAEVHETVDALIQAQPLIGALAADPTVRGLAGVLGQMTDALESNQVPPAQLERPLGLLAAAAESAVAGAPQPLSWRSLMADKAAAAMPRRQLVLLDPVLDYSALQPGAAAAAALREEARALGLAPDRGVRVRVTGIVAVSDEEFASVAEGSAGTVLLSLGLLAGLLLLATRSVRLVVAILATIVTGLIVTSAFAALAVRSLNMISVAFGVLFIGLAVDFAIQFTIRYRAERNRVDDLAEALGGAARGISGALLLAGTATAVGFFAFLPTDYRGVSELGLIAGTGMIIALALSFTVLPALIALLRPAPEPEPPGYAWAAGIDSFLLRRRRLVWIAALLAGAASIALSVALRFDSDPLNLKDPKAEAVATLRDLAADVRYAPQRIAIIAPSVPAAEALAGRLGDLPTVEDVLTIASLIPAEQDEKLALLDDARQMLGPPLELGTTVLPPSAGETRTIVRGLADKLRGVSGLASAPRLAEALDKIARGDAAMLAALQNVWMTGLPRRLDDVRALLQAGPVRMDTLPKSLVRDWVAPDGRAKIEVQPRGELRDPELLKKFVADVRSIAPDATGPPVTMLESGRTVVKAFSIAGAAALIAIALLVFAVLRRVDEMLLVFAPLALAALLTTATMVVLDLPLNYANVIALPLLAGIGVAFDIYFVMNWRAGMTGLLQSSTARAVVFSALTTACAFGSLGFSRHPGTADMGVLLLISLGYTVLCTLFVLPALLGPGRSSDFLKDTV